MATMFERPVSTYACTKCGRQYRFVIGAMWLSVCCQAYVLPVKVESGKD